MLNVISIDATLLNAKKTENCECDKSNIIDHEDDPFGEKQISM